MQPKTFLLICSLVTASLSAVQAAPVRKIVPKGRTAYKSADYRFAVWLPLRPSISRDNSPPVRAVTFQADTPTVTYGLNVYMPLADQSFRVSQAGVFLDTFDTLIARNMSGRLVSRQDIQLGAAKGRAIRISAAQGQVTTFARSYFMPRFMYQLTATVRTALLPSQSAQINRVFDSFRILSQ